MFPTSSINSATSFCKGDVILFGDEEFCVKTFVAESGDSSRCDNAVELVLKEAPVWTAFAGAVGAVTVVDEDFHVSVVLLLQQSPDSNGKDSNTVIIDYQENTGWLFFKMYITAKKNLT